ncbi:MAG: 4Fe-4S dicluster domain-containing protein [Chitinophagales bacterium]|jgi:heterodisulfide reductase subunit C|nr:(Fe-S)-binding protein [Sphingobacteriales bacterium]
MISILVFCLLLAVVIFFSIKKYKRIYSNIQLGKTYSNPNGTLAKLKNMALIALGQKKMFSRPIAAIFHLFIYIAFVFTQLELIEILIDGFTGSHRILGHAMLSCCSWLYTSLINTIEILSLLALIATVVFLSRRNLLKLPRLNMAELKGWPMKDANIILIGEIFLVFGIFLMNGAESFYMNITSQEGYSFFISSKIAFIFNGLHPETVVFLSKFGWWMHLIGILGFILYLPHSKHLHILLAFPNAYLSNPNAKGHIAYMPEILHEIKSMMGEPVEASDPNAMPKFGAKDIFDLSQKNLLDAYACTECGRCTSACPANQTGKKLSPRKIMMDTRDRLEEVGKLMEANNNEWKEDGKSLLHNYISVEELRGCTTCNACVEECPINISPLDIIVQLRRNLIMEESNSPQEWNGMFGNIENNGAPWKFAQSERGNWAK